MFTVRRLPDFNSTPLDRHTWNRLADGVPFRQWDWVTAWWRHFSSLGQLYLLVVEDPTGQVVGIAPWFLESHPLTGRTVRFLGSGDVCSDYLTVLADSASTPAVTAALARWLVEANASRGDDCWDLIHLDGGDLQQDGLAQFLTAATEQGCEVHSQPTAKCWRIAICDKWEHYLLTLPKSHRRHMRQAHHRLFEEPEFQVRVAEDAASFARGWEQFVEIHQRRRVSLGQPGCFANERFAGFLTETVAEHQANGQLRLIVIEREGGAVAALLMLVGGGVSYAYQMGVNPEFMADSPGWLVVAAAIQLGLERGDHSLDLLRGDEPYKGRMGATPNDMFELRVVPPQLASRLRHTAWLTGTAVKQWIRSGLHSAGL